jgi:hypothetical protein
MTDLHITSAGIDTIIDVLDREARTEIARVFGSADTSCMTCTCVILDVLAAFAVPARPLTVWATVTNATYEHLLNPADGQPVQELDLPRAWRGWPMGRARLATCYW